MACSELDRNHFLIFYSLMVLSFASASLDDDHPYCALRYRRLCHGKGRHVGCQYSHPGPGAECRNYTQIKFTARLRHFIISYINRRRQRVAAGTERVRGGAFIPKPQIMMMVVWDRELAMLAQRLADQCSFMHDDCRATVRYPYSGQTVGEVRWRGSNRETDTMSAQRAIKRVFDAWWGERRRVQPQELISPFKMSTKGSPWGHFSQLAVWALAAAGCGAARHGNPRRLLLVCDFSHTNMLGQSTLIAGEPAPCPTHSVRKSRSAYPMLCAPLRVPDQSGSEDSEEYGVYEDTPKLFDDGDDRVSSAIDQKITHTTLRRYQSKFKNATKLWIVKKLEKELELKSCTSYIDNKYLKEGRKDGKRLHSTPYLGENHEEEFDFKARYKINTARTYPYSSDEFTTATFRRKWKQTRQRPRRPGAGALISQPMENVLRRSSVASLRLDREDLEQLFQDTGFHKHWKSKTFP